MSSSCSVADANLIYMDYTYKPKSSSKRACAIIAVLVLHILIIYALLTGLARKAVEVLKKPIEASIVDEVKSPPPPPPPSPPPSPRSLPKFESPPPPMAPPLPYIPPVEVAVPSPPAPAITVASSEPPKTEYKIAPSAPPAPLAPPEPPPAPPRPALTTISRLPDGCAPESPPVREMSRASITRVEGSILATVNPDGTFSNIRVKSVEPTLLRGAIQRTFQGSLTGSACRIKAEGNRFEVEIPYVFKLN